MNSSSSKVLLSDLERRHRLEFRRETPPATRRELVRSGVLAAVTTPWLLATFGIIPMIGQGLVIVCAAFVAAYLWARRSVFLAVAVIGSFLAVFGLFLIFVQAIKYRLEIVLFILVSTGIPVTIALTVFVAVLLWLQYSPEEF